MRKRCKYPYLPGSWRKDVQRFSASVAVWRTSAGYRREEERGRGDRREYGFAWFYWGLLYFRVLPWSLDARSRARSPLLSANRGGKGKRGEKGMAQTAV